MMEVIIHSQYDYLLRIYVRFYLKVYKLIRVLKMNRHDFSLSKISKFILECSIFLFCLACISK